MKKNISFIFLLWGGSVLAAENKFDPAGELYKIIENCESNGYATRTCQSRFYGGNRGGFWMMIERDDLKRVELEFDTFMKELKLNASDQSILDEYNPNVISKMSAKIDYDQLKKIPIHEQNGQYIFLKDKKTALFALIKEDGIWKLGIPSNMENEFENSDNYVNYLIMRLKRIVLQYHMEQSKELKLTYNETRRRTNDSMLPILLRVEPEFEKSNKFKKPKKTFEEIYQYFINLDSEELRKAKILQK